MQNFEQMGRELERRGKTDGIKKLAESADGKKLGSMIDPNAIEKAARSGDSAALRGMISAVLGTEEGRRLAENVRRLMED